MPAPETVTLVKDGRPISVAPADAGPLIAQGYQPEGADQRWQREQGEIHEANDPGALTAGIMGGLRGATFGASDAVVSAFGGADQLKSIRDDHGTASFIGQLAGGLVAPGVPGVAGIGEKIAGAAEGGGMAAKLAASAAHGAVEGVPFGVGAYVSDVALGDRDLSADGFVGAMKEGALWGAAGGAALGATEKGFTYARKMFPKEAITDKSVGEALDKAISEMVSARDDGIAMSGAAREQMRNIREVVAADPVFGPTLDQIAQAEAAKMAAKVNPQTTIDGALGGAPEAAGPELAAAAGPSGDTLVSQTSSAPEATEVPAAKPKRGRGKRKVIAAAEDAAAPAGDDLMAQLQGTKAALDGGKALGDVSHVQIEDAVNAHVAKTDPQMAKLVGAEKELREAGDAMDAWLDKYQGGATAKFQRGQSAREYAEAMRPKEAGYYTKVPEGEGTVGLPRGRQFEFRGTAAEREAMDASLGDKFKGSRTLAERIVDGDQELASVKGEGYEPTIKGKSAAERVEGTPGKGITADDIIEASNAQRADRGMPPLDEKIRGALRAKVNKYYVNDDLDGAIDAIGRYERAHAEMVDAIGPTAPPAAIERAQQFRAAEQAHEDRFSSMLSDTVAKANEVAPAAEAGGGGFMDKAKQVMGGLGHVGELTEVLRMMGIPVPDPKHIPIVGPLLSLFLKARVGSRVLGKAGMMVPKSVEGAIAQHASGTLGRVYGAMDKMLAGGARAAVKATGPAAGMAAILGHSLFATPGGPAPKTKGTPGELYQARLHELAQASQPGAVEAAVKAQVPASDPSITDAVAATARRKLEYLLANAPKPSGPGGLLDLEKAWTPARSELETFARRVAAADDPAAVIERSASGQFVSIEEIDTVKNVYPALYRAAQQRLLAKVTEAPQDVPYARRIQLSILWEVPLDASMAPDYAAFLASTYKQPPHAPGAGGPPQPTISADVNLGARTANPMDAR